MSAIQHNTAQNFSSKSGQQHCRTAAKSSWQHGRTAVCYWSVQTAAQDWSLQTTSQALIGKTGMETAYGAGSAKVTVCVAAIALTSFDILQPLYVICTSAHLEA